MKRLQEERTALEESLPEEKAAEATVQEENRVDLAAILQEINNKLDALTGQVAELKDEVSVLKLNVNDVVGKTEQAHKEVAEIRNLVYAIKYER
jgi:SMC interacting uncharacterized protein involved in chromosome segregation